jgi:hypothetical protein
VIADTDGCTKDPQVCVRVSPELGSERDSPADRNTNTETDVPGKPGGPSNFNSRRLTVEERLVRSKGADTATNVRPVALGGEKVENIRGGDSDGTPTPGAAQVLVDLEFDPHSRHWANGNATTNVRPNRNVIVDPMEDHSQSSADKQLRSDAL